MSKTMPLQKLVSLRDLLHASADQIDVDELHYYVTHKLDPQYIEDWTDCAENAEEDLMTLRAHFEEYYEEVQRIIDRINDIAWDYQNKGK